MMVIKRLAAFCPGSILLNIRVVDPQKDECFRCWSRIDDNIYDVKHPNSGFTLLILLKAE